MIYRRRVGPRAATRRAGSSGLATRRDDREARGDDREAREAGGGAGDEARPELVELVAAALDGPWPKSAPQREEGHEAEEAEEAPRRGSPSGAAATGASGRLPRSLSLRVRRMRQAAAEDGGCGAAAASSDRAARGAATRRRASAPRGRVSLRMRNPRGASRRRSARRVRAKAGRDGGAAGPPTSPGVLRRWRASPPTTTTTSPGVLAGCVRDATASGCRPGQRQCLPVAASRCSAGNNDDDLTRACLPVTSADLTRGASPVACFRRTTRRTTDLTRRTTDLTRGASPVACFTANNDDDLTRGACRLRPHPGCLPVA